MRTAGIGSRKDVTTVEVLAAVDVAVASHGLTRAALDALATVPLKKDEAAIRQAARTLRLPLLIASDEALASASRRAVTHSMASTASTGAPSASESAALAAAGTAGRLLGPRVVVGNVTCAIAVSEEAP